MTAGKEEGMPPSCAPEKAVFVDAEIPLGVARIEWDKATRLPTREEVSRFSIPRDAPVLIVERTYYDSGDRVLSFSRSLYMEGAEYRHHARVSDEVPGFERE